MHRPSSPSAQRCRPSLRLIIFSVVALWTSEATAVPPQNLGNIETPMQFSTAFSGGNCGGCVWISGIGDIVPDTPETFHRFLQTTGALNWRGRVFLHSNGGNLIAGIRLGEIIRQFGLSTRVGETKNDPIPGGSIVQTVENGICASACAYAFLGGVDRQLEDEYFPGLGASKIGFHQFYNAPGIEEVTKRAQGLEELEISGVQLVSGLIVAYLVEIGVDAKVLLIASVAGPNDMVYPPDHKLKELKVLTNDRFGNWWIEPYRDGLIAASREENPLT